MFVQRKGKLCDVISRTEESCRVSADFTGGGCSQISLPALPFWSSAVSMYLQCEEVSPQALTCCVQQLCSRFPTVASKTFFFFYFRKSCYVFSVGCCQGANQNPTPDRRQNSCRLQINVGCNSTAICPRLQLLTASPKTPPSSSRNPTSDSFSALIPDPRPCRVCVCVLLPDREDDFVW